MMFSILLLLLVVFLAYKAAPRERQEEAQVHGAGQLALPATLALFGVDYFTSYYYATGEMMSALHPYGLQQYAYIPVAVIAFANFAFGLLYMYSLGPFHEGGGAYTASMRYLWSMVSLTVAITLIEDYILTVVVSALSGADQLLSILNAYDSHWFWHFAIGVALAAVTWYLTIRGRGESAQVVFTLLCVFVMLTLTMAAGLFIAHLKGVPPVHATETPEPVSAASALLHMLTASMKGMVALTGLEAMSNGIQFVINEDAGVVTWGKRHLPRLNWLWNFYSGKSGIGRFVQTSFLFYGGLTTLFLTFFSLRFNVFDGTLGRTLVGNLASIGFSQVPGGIVLFWTYQILAVGLLVAASMTAFQDVQATEWRDVAIGEIPEVIIYRDERGTFTRSVTTTFILAGIIMLLVRGQTTVAVPFYGIGVFLPIGAMGVAIRQHVREHLTGRARALGSMGATFAAVLAGIVLIGQVVGRWEEGGWIRLITFGVLVLIAHLILISPIGFREPKQIDRIVRQKARVHGAMAFIVEWQAFKMQEYRHRLLIGIAGFLEHFGIGRAPRRAPAPAPAGDYPIPQMLNIKSILFPLLATTPSDLLEMACKLAQQDHSQVTALYVIEVPMSLPLSAPLPRETAAAQRALDRAQAIAEEYGVPIETRVVQARLAGRLIVETAKDLKADLILLEAGRRRQLGEILFGKTVDYVLRNATCRVLVSDLPVEPGAGGAP